MDARPKNQIMNNTIIKSNEREQQKSKSNFSV